jgi:hypothetical protein
MRTPRLRVAVVGGGIFGATAAVELAQHGYRVELFEQADDLLLSASGINQYRLHRGYHYPRSRETATDCRDSEPVFRDSFPEAVLNGTDHFYAIAARDSLTSADQYLAFCRDLELEVEVDRPSMLRPEAIALSVRVRESLFDPAILRRLVWTRLREAGVDVHLNTRIEPEQLEAFPQSVIATYAELNRLLPDAAAQRAYQFEVCEKPVVRLPERYTRQSVVVMDGPFMCFDPLGNTGMFVLGNVVHAIHERSVGPLPEVSPELGALLNRGIVSDPPITNIERFIAAGAELFDGFDEAEHVGSMFTIRTVLPGVDRTDARPTLIREIDDHTITLFSGKVDTCISAAEEVATLVDVRTGRGPTHGRRAGDWPSTRIDISGNDRGAA